jgi:hypothetical protein
VARGDGKEANPEFVQLLRSYNQQRVKTRETHLREAVFDASAKENAQRALSAYLRKKSDVKVEEIEIHETRARSEISPAKFPFLNAARAIIREHDRDAFGPITARQIHYKLLNDPPLKHAGKPESRYRNNDESYRSLIDLLTRARHEGYIEYDDVADPTRPVIQWDVHRNVADYLRKQFDHFLGGYDRDLMQGQTNHVEILAEKLTVEGVIQPVAAKYGIPLTITRGQCSTRPLYDIAQRFKGSGKEKLIILAISDLDPDGDAIAHSIGQRLSDDFQIDTVAPIKVALTMEQVRALQLPESYERAKRTSTNYSRYPGSYRTDCIWELESLDPADLQRLLALHIEAVIDRAAFNHEIAEQKKDHAHLGAVRKEALKFLQDQITV